jgi:3-oxoacyl-[acyl-carrier-protein] synthase III
MRVTGERKAVGKIVGVGRALGGRIVSNHDLAKVVDTDAAWIVARTGIRERRFVEDGEDCVTLAIEASKEALEHSKLFGDAIDLVICATTTAPESSPSVACLLSDAVGGEPVQSVKRRRVARRRTRLCRPRRPESVILSPRILPLR